jgi:putative ABC transport system permease protein
MKKGSWVYFPSLLVNEDFVETMGITLLAGRDFSKEFPRDDSLSVVINEAMLGRMGWKTPEEALGKQFNTPTGSEKIIGVVKDFHFESLQNPIGPFVLDMPHKLQKPFWTRYIGIQLAPGNVQAQLASVEKSWNKHSTEHPFEFSFLDDQLNQQYKEQENLARLFSGFSILAVFIASLGLLALSAFSAEQRTREIGIRKVMGASVASIIRLLSFDFLKLVIIANIIALPLTWYFMGSWLKNFSFRIDIPIVSFLSAAAISMILAFLTVSFQSVKAAMADPVKSLKHE